MKYPTGNAPPRRLVNKRKPTQLYLRTSSMEPEDGVEVEQKSHFWRWFGLVALLHIVAIALFALLYQSNPTPPPPVQFMSLLPEGDVVKGTPSVQEAHKVGHPVLAHSVHHEAPPPQEEAVQPPPAATPTPKPVEPTPLITPDAPNLAVDKPVTIPKPTPPKPKVKVDLTLVDGPVLDNR